MKCAKCETTDLKREYLRLNTSTGAVEICNDCVAEVILGRHPSVKKAVPHDWNPLAYQTDQIYAKCRKCSAATESVKHSRDLGRVKAIFNREGCTGGN